MSDQQFSGDPAGQSPTAEGPDAATLARADAAPTGRRVSSIPRRLTSAGSETCPICDSAMVLRKARRGPKAGTTFWSCERYPSCHGARDATVGAIGSKSRSRSTRRSSKRMLIALAALVPALLLVSLAVVLSNDTTQVAATSPRLSSPVSASTTEAAQANLESSGQQPMDLAISPDGTQLYSANAGSGDVTVFDTNSMSVVETIDVPGEPVSVALAGSTLYLADRAAAKVYAINRRTGEKIDSFSTEPDPVDVAVDTKSDRLFVADAAGTVTVYSLKSGSRLADPDFVPAKSIAVDSNGNEVYINDSLGTLHTYRTGTYRASSRQSADASYVGTGAITLDANGKRLYVSRGSKLRERNLDTGKSRLIDLPIDAQAVAVDPSEDRAFVADPDTNQVKAVSLG